MPVFHRACAPSPVTLLVAAVALGACTDPVAPPGAVQTSAPPLDFDPTDSNIVSWPPDSFIGWTTWEPIVLQPDTVVLLLESPVQSVVITGGSHVECVNGPASGIYGTVIGYDAAGNELGRQDLEKMFIEICGDPNAPGGSTYNAVFQVRATLTVSSPAIIRVKITPFANFEFTGYGPFGEPFTDKGHIRYLTDFPPPPGLNVACTPGAVVREDSVSCVAKLDDPTVSWHASGEACTWDLVVRNDEQHRSR